MNTGIEEGEGRTEERKNLCSWTAIMATHAYTKNNERERALEASRRQKWTSRIRTSGDPSGHPRHDS